MTIEELLDYPAEKTEKMTDKELIEYFTPFFPVTRPELVNKEKSSGQSRVSKQEEMELKIKLNKAKALAKSFGIDLGK